jgi:hypothetical protein
MAELLVLEPSASEIGIVFGKLRPHSVGIDQIWTASMQQDVKHRVLKSVNLFIGSGVRKPCLIQ